MSNTCDDPNWPERFRRPTREAAIEQALLKAEVVAAYLTKSLIRRAPVLLNAGFAAETMKIESAIRGALAELQRLRALLAEPPAPPDAEGKEGK